jgi:hypothetical protein
MNEPLIVHVADADGVLRRRFYEFGASPPEAVVAPASSAPVQPLRKRLAQAWFAAVARPVEG